MEIFVCAEIAVIAALLALVVILYRKILYLRFWVREERIERRKMKINLLNSLKP